MIYASIYYYAKSLSGISQDLSVLMQQK